jgi:hypothetical protein
MQVTMSAVLAMSSSISMRAAVTTRRPTAKAQAPAPKATALAARRNGASCPTTQSIHSLQ